MFSTNKEIRDDLYCAENLVVVESEDSGISIIIKAQLLKIPIACAEFRAEAFRERGAWGGRGMC